jgi:hypothetical protein
MLLGKSNRGWGCGVRGQAVLTAMGAWLRVLCLLAWDGGLSMGNHPYLCMLLMFVSSVCTHPPEYSCGYPRHDDSRGKGRGKERGKVSGAVKEGGRMRHSTLYN